MGTTAIAALRATTIGRSSLPMLAVALTMLLAVSSSRAQLEGTSSIDEGQLLHATAGQRGLLAANDNGMITIVPRTNVTKAELIKLLDIGVAPVAIPANAFAPTVAAAGGRKLSQQTGYCRNSYYNCGRGCYLRCSGSTGYCYKNLWRCSGTSNTWYCSCGRYLYCYTTSTGVYATCRSG